MEQCPVAQGKEDDHLDPAPEVEFLPPTQHLEMLLFYPTFANYILLGFWGFGVLGFWV